MIKKLILGLVASGVLAASSTPVFAGGGIFGSDIGLVSNLFNGGGNTFYEASLLGDGRHAPIAGATVTLPVTLNTTGFNGLNLGNFNPGAGDTLILIGGGVLTFKNNGTDITGAFVNYSIDGGSFSGLSLTFNEDSVNGATGDQRWAQTNYSINLLSGLSAGVHTIAFYTNATTNSVDAPPEFFDSNMGNNFVATFTVIPEPSTVSLLAGPVMLGAWFFVRRRRA